MRITDKLYGAVDNWVLAGSFGVDSGLCWIGDPCYVLHKTKDEIPDTLGSDWSGFVDKLYDLNSHSMYTAFGYRSGMKDGLGICVSTGYGDGEYPVYVGIKDGRVAAAFIDFFGLLDEDD